MIFKNNKFVLLYINFGKKNYFFENQCILNKLGNLTSFVYFFIYFFKKLFFLKKKN